ncbi:MAG: phosphatidate cytidylyltransferase [Anaerolineaceae bacterium]|nr:phosphatidate cytidylyltransferase [Anaerolineaceae bacterium]
MLNKRLLTAAIIIPIGVGFIVLGGWFFTFFIAVVLAVAAWEYWHLYQLGGYSPNAPVLFASVILLVFFRYLFSFEGSDIILALSIMAAMAFHTLSYELKREHASIDFGITLGGILYIGWLGSYLISLRMLPDGLWWILLTIPTVGIGDAGAYFIGVRFGKNKMAPRVSPKKSWEGYLGGVLFSIIGGAGLGLLWHTQTDAITLTNGLILGTALGILTPLGDLGESMLKRQFNVKDSSNLLPGHGGFMDRIDSWLWAACISFYTILWFF